MIIGFTGMRPQKLGGFSLPNPTYNYVCQETEKLLLKHKPDKVLSGLCIGYDWYAANIAIKLKIPVIGIIPFEGQELNWPAPTQKTYKALRKQMSEEVIISSGGYAAYKMQVRNEYIVNNCGLLIGCWNETSGGTGNTIAYAKKVKRDIIVIDPRLANNTTMEK